MPLPKLILLEVPEDDDPECALAELKDAFAEHLGNCEESRIAAGECSVCALVKQLAASARLVDLEARKKHPEMDDHMCPPDGCTQCARGEGYNACLEDLAKGV